MQGPARKIFIEFLERSCTAEFSGFLLYKELGRRLKKTNPVVAEVSMQCFHLTFITASSRSSPRTDVVFLNPLGP